MDTNDRPEGRKKRIGSGAGGVFKRGDGLSDKTGGPVGEADGYSDRTEGSAAEQEKGLADGLGGSIFGGGVASGGLSSGGAGAPAGSGTSGGGRRPSIGCSPKMLLMLVVIVAIIGVVVYMVSRSSSGGTDGTASLSTTGSSGLASASTLSPSTTLDHGCVLGRQRPSRKLLAPSARSLRATATIRSRSWCTCARPTWSRRAAWPPPT